MNFGKTGPKEGLYVIIRGLCIGVPLQCKRNVIVFTNFNTDEEDFVYTFELI
jgi:hypothetical protein